MKRFQPAATRSTLDAMTTTMLQSLDRQIAFCTALDAGFSAAVIAAVRADVAAGGASLVVLDDWLDASEAELTREAVPLRLLGGLHLAVLKGEEAALAAAYPKPGFAGDAAAMARLIPEVLRRRAEALKLALQLPPQTNEVLRSAALLSGFLTVAQETRLPLRCLELGASAGLNQSWDAYGYHLGDDIRRGPMESPVQLSTDWRGPAPPDPPWPVVVERRACDQAPVDVADPDQALRLQSFVWPDQIERLPRLKAAIALAVAKGVRVEQADAVAWAEAHVGVAPGTATVLYHSILRQYLSPDGRARLDSVIARAAAAATARQPFAWLRMEGLPHVGYEVRLTLWPGGEDRLLAETHPHGQWVAWKAAPKP